MNKSKVSILFILQRARLNRQNECPIRCRITYISVRKEFATGQFINPDFWNSNKQLAELSKNNNINIQLSLIKSKINKAFLFLQYEGEEFNATDIFNQFKGKKLNTDRTIKDAFNFHIDRMQKLVGIEITQTSVDKYPQTQKHVVSFLWLKFKKKDYLLKDLKLSFINDFEYYLKVDKRFMSNTVYKTIQRFKRVIRVAVGANYLTKNPFIFHKIKKPKKEIVYLDANELERLEKYKFSQKRLQQVRDMFVFCCYTGLAFNEMSTLSQEHIITGFDGNKWIKMVRQKTGFKVSIPLLPKALIISYSIEKSKDDVNKILPTISNQKFNSYLKEIAEVVGIKKILTHHIARKTFATTVLLYNDVPMEIVSELLGHSKISITQDHYAKVVQKKVSEHIEILKNKLEE